MFEIQGKVALITGGISGIGLAITIELLENKIKALVLVDINEDLGNNTSEELNRKYEGSKILFVKADVRNQDNFKDAFKSTINTFGNLDIVINCAGIFNDEAITDEIDVNYKGTVYGCILGLEHYLPKYKSGNEAVILNIASIAGLMACEQIPIYSSIKWAVIGLTRSLGTDEHYKRTKVKVIALCPGYTDTPMLHSNSYLGPAYKALDVCAMSPCKWTTQPATCVGKASSFVITEGGNGSVWVATNEQSPYEYKFLTPE